MKNFIVQKTSIPLNIFDDLVIFTNSLIEKFRGKSLVITDDQLKSKIPDIYEKLKRHYNKSDIYFTIRISTSDNNINNLFHYDAHKNTIVVPLKFMNFNEHNNGDLLLSKKIRDNDSFVLNLFKKILKQNFVYRYLSLKLNLDKFEKIEFNIGDEVLFKGFYTYHGNRFIDPGKTRASLIIHYDEVFSDSLLFKFIKKVRHMKYQLKN